MRVSLLAFTMLLVCMGQTAYAQIDKWSESYQMEQVKKYIAEEVSDLPSGVRRAAVYKINYNARNFDKESIAYIKNEVESVFRDFTPVVIISPPELDPTENLKIVGSDSTLRLMNIKGRSMADMSPELLEQVSSKYSVSGLIELTIQKKRPEGLMVAIKMISPQSREIVWSKSFEAYPVEEEEKVDLGKRVVLNFGVTLMTNESYVLGFNPVSEVTEDSRSMNYNFTIGYRQPLNLENSSYLGIFTGWNTIRSGDNPDFENSFWEIGLSFDQAISRRSPDINGYRVMMGVDAAVWLPQNNKKGDIIVASPSIMFTLTKNIGFEVIGMAFLSQRSVQDQVSLDKYTYGQLGYGVRAHVQF